MLNISNIIIFILIAFIFYLYFHKKYEWFIVILGVCYCILPSFKYGHNNGIDSAYFITLLILIISIIEILRTKKIILNKLQLSYLLMNVIVILIYMIAWLINGCHKFSDLVAFCGIGQYVMAIIGISYLINLFKVDFKTC
jgi:heme exporter protein D